jgi:hypothetical protein
MSILAIYVLFATSVALLACYDIMWPALDSLEKTNPTDVLVQNKTLSYVVMFCVGWIAAPFMIFCILNTQLRMRMLMAIILKD